MTTDPVYLSHVQVRPGGGPDKLVRLPAEDQEVLIGVHGAIAERLKAPADLEPHAATLDYLVAAAAACLSGTFARALQARGITVNPAIYHSDAVGEVHDRRGVLVLERIEVRHSLSVAAEQRPVVERVHGIYEQGCAVSRSIAGAIEIDSVLLLD